MEKVNHYKWLDENFFTFLEKVSGKSKESFWAGGIISAHGDKCYGYKSKWEEAGIPFPHGVAIYFLSYLDPWGYETRETLEHGWVDVGNWVVENYERFKPFLPEIKEV